jgi:hypothetical protein
MSITGTGTIDLYRILCVLPLSRIQAQYTFRRTMMQKPTMCILAVLLCAVTAGVQTGGFEIRNGVLVRCRGNAAEAVAPDDVTAIGERAFSTWSLFQNS